MPNLDLLEKITNTKAIYIVSLLGLGVAIIANFVGTNTLATQGFAVSGVESSTIELEKQNRELRVQIEEKSNLKNMASLAEFRGFINTSDIVFMPTPPTTALR